MGYTRHDAVIAIGNPISIDGAAALDQAINELRARMVDEIGRSQSQLLVGPIETPSNGGVVYAYLPDNSKEGWTTSDLHNQWRKEFLDLLDAQPYWQVLLARFGGDEPSWLEASVRADGEETVSAYQVAWETTE